MIKPNNPSIFFKAVGCFTFAAVICTALTGCETDPITAFNRAWNKDAKGTVTPVSADTLQIKVPKNTGVHPLNAQGTSVVVRDLAYIDQIVKNGPVTTTGQMGIFKVEASRSNPSSFSRLLYESPQNGSFAVHGRYDNGAAGSGVRYRIQYTITDEPDDYIVNLKPVTREVYQQGIGSSFKLPVPDFKVDNVYQALANVSIVYTFEIDTPYPTDSVTANFMRSTAVQRIKGSYTDPVTGKIISTAYQLPMGDTMATFSVDAYPYHNGSKAVVTALIPGKQTSADMVDFKMLVNQVKVAITSIAQS